MSQALDKSYFISMVLLGNKIMKLLTRSILLVIIAMPVFAEETEQQQEAIKKAYPWVFAGDDAFRYQTVSLDEIGIYCGKNEGEMSIWYEEYKKRFGEFKEREIPEAERRPENGLMRGLPLMVQIYVTFYINKRASEGWKMVGASQNFFVFERSGDPKGKVDPDAQ